MNTIAFIGLLLGVLFFGILLGFAIVKFKVWKEDIKNKFILQNFCENNCTLIKIPNTEIISIDRIIKNFKLIDNIF